MWEKIASFSFEIGEREFRKDSAFFAGLLAPAFAMHLRVFRPQSRAAAIR